MNIHALDSETATRGVTLCELRRTSCRWPLGGMLEHVEFYCGEHTSAGCPYCSEHRKRAFVQLRIVSTKKRPLVLKDIRR